MLMSSSLFAFHSIYNRAWMKRENKSVSICQNTFTFIRLNRSARDIYFLPLAISFENNSRLELAECPTRNYPHSVASNAPKTSSAFRQTHHMSFRPRPIPFIIFPIVILFIQPMSRYFRFRASLPFVFLFREKSSSPQLVLVTSSSVARNTWQGVY